MKSIGRMTQSEVAAFVCDSLARQGIRVVLSGGAAVAIYSENRYASQDVVLINAYQVRQSTLSKHRLSPGSVEHGLGYRYSQSAVLVSSPIGSLAFGGEPVEETLSLEFPTGVLKIVSPTDCIKDRLAAFYYWGDRQALAQAVLVAAHQPFDMEDVARWSKAEGHARAFRAFRDSLPSTPGART